MVKKNFVLGLILAIIFMGCTMLPKKTYKIVKDKNGKDIAVGIIPEKDLLREFPSFSAQYKAFVPDSNAVAYLSHFKKPVKVLVFLGTWCPDSRREVPRFLKALAKAHNPSSIAVKLIAVNRSKIDAENLSKKYKITRVPTFVVFSNQSEVGRIVEYPKVSMEGDFVKILKPIH